MHSLQPQPNRTVVWKFSGRISRFMNDLTRGSSGSYPAFPTEGSKPRVLQLAPADVASSSTAFAATVRRPNYCTIFSSLPLSLFLSSLPSSLSYALTPPRRRRIRAFKRFSPLPSGRRDGRRTRAHFRALRHSQTGHWLRY